MRIRRLRTRLGLSQEALGHRVDRSEGWVYQVEKGEAEPGYLDLLKIAEVFNVTLVQLLDDRETRELQQAKGKSASPTSSSGVTRAPDPGMMEADRWPAGIDPGEWLEEMRRRAFLRAMATMTGATAVGWWPSPGTAGQIQPQVVTLRDALLGHDAQADAGLDPADLGSLRRSVHTLWGAFQGARYSAALAMMPSLVRQGQRAVRVLDGDDRLAASILLAETYQAVSTFMRKVGDFGLATIAADRAMSAARLHGSAVALAQSARFLGLVLGDTGHHEQAIRVCTEAAGRFETEEGRPSPAALSIYGQLVLAGAEAAAQRGDAALCRDFFSTAVDVGRRVGGDANHSFTAFGPTNIGVHRVHASVVLGDGELAVRQSQVIDLRRLPVVERRAHHLLDVALGYNLIDKTEDAAVSLLTAETVAAEEIRYDPLARLLVEQLRQRSRSLGSQLDALAGRMPPLPS